MRWTLAFVLIAFAVALAFGLWHGLALLGSWICQVPTLRQQTIRLSLGSGLSCFVLCWMWVVGARWKLRRLPDVCRNTHRMASLMYWSMIAFTMLMVLLIGAMLLTREFAWSVLAGPILVALILRPIRRLRRDTAGSVS